MTETKLRNIENTQKKKQNEFGILGFASSLLAIILILAFLVIYSEILINSIIFSLIFGVVFSVMGLFKSPRRLAVIGLVISLIFGCLAVGILNVTTPGDSSSNKLNEMPF